MLYYISNIIVRQCQFDHFGIFDQIEIGFEDIKSIKTNLFGGKPMMGNEELGADETPGKIFKFIQMMKR